MASLVLPRSQAGVLPRFYAAAMLTWANPVDLDYRYSAEQQREGISYRTGADPVVVRWDDAYVLFATLAGGYWTSTDLAHWTFIEAEPYPSEPPVAPAVVNAQGKLFMLPSAMEPTFIWESMDPLGGKWRKGPLLAKVGPPAGPWDPAFFRDTSGVTYLYWGSSNLFPLYGAQVDLATGKHGVTVPLVNLDPAAHGWERFGRDHRDEKVKPFLEGAWMNEVGDRYYLQYAAPGTEENVYATGVYTGDSPLGPFAYAPYNPVGYKPGGFVTGAGHGSTFEDAHGNFWSTATSWVGVNWPFERRVALFPAGFHPDGQMWIDTRFGDFPHRVTEHGGDFTGWMLLSYRKAVSASSSQRGHAPSAAADENIRTYWLSASSAPGETLTVDLGGQRTVRAVQVSFADHASGRYGGGPEVYTHFVLQGSSDGKSFEVIADLAKEKRDRPNAYVELAAPARIRYVRYVHGHTPGPLAIADLRVFGNDDGPMPAAPKLVSAVRKPDRRNAVVTWKPVPGAVGYNVRWGLYKDRLYSTYQRWADQPTRVELRALSRGVTYVVVVEAFDERGVSGLSELRVLTP